MTDFVQGQAVVTTEDSRPAYRRGQQGEVLEIGERYKPFDHRVKFDDGMVICYSASELRPVPECRCSEERAGDHLDCPACYVEDNTDSEPAQGVEAAGKKLLDYIKASMRAHPEMGADKLAERAARVFSAGYDQKAQGVRAWGVHYGDKFLWANGEDLSNTVEGCTVVPGRFVPDSEDDRQGEIDQMCAACAAAGVDADELGGRPCCVDDPWLVARRAQQAEGRTETVDVWRNSESGLITSHDPTDGRGDRPWWIKGTAAFPRPVQAPDPLVEAIAEALSNLHGVGVDEVADEAKELAAAVRAAGFEQKGGNR
jgi:hypothetical protein